MPAVFTLRVFAKAPSLFYSYVKNAKKKFGNPPKTVDYGKCTAYNERLGFGYCISGYIPNCDLVIGRIHAVFSPLKSF